jgi:hypothetical protein
MRHAVDGEERRRELRRVDARGAARAIIASVIAVGDAPPAAKDNPRARVRGAACRPDELRS